MAQNKQIQDDAVSTFSYDGDGEPDIFSLHQLQVTLRSHFSVPTELEKLAESSYHKVYEVVRKEDGVSIGVVRVASPAFPKDKIESEVATLKHLAAHTTIPVPLVYAWNSDASNPVGAEYMIMQKMPGISADTQWETLPMRMKERVVSQVAQHLKAMFALRFERAGSLYLSPSRNDVYVGPIVSTPFYRAIDGTIRVPDIVNELHTELAPFRGPFSNATDYLQSFLRPELHMVSHHRPFVLAELEEAVGEHAECRLETGERALHKALALCAVYPGNHIPGGPITTPTRQFTLRLDDFRLSNIMIDESGTVTGLIDFEGTTVSPLWESAVVPGWLLDPDKDPESKYEGGPKEDRRHLLDVFWKAMDDAEWRAMYEHGKPFRRLVDRLSFRVDVWASRGGEEWVDERLAWAESHPGIPLP